MSLVIKPKTESVLEKIQEFVRDFTGLGNPFILALLGVLVFGISTNLIILYSLWALNEVICSLIKYFFPTERPIPMGSHNWLERIEASSFPSIHSSRWGVFVAVACWSGSPVITIGILFSFMLIIGYTRIFLQKHYWRDVSIGWGIGLAFGSLVLLL